jgi:hypothetical protein
MSRKIIQQALDSNDAGASLVDQALRGLGIHDPAEVKRATDMLQAGIAYFDSGKRGHELDKWFREVGSLENAIEVVGSQYRASKGDIDAFVGVLDDMGSILAGHESLESIYPDETDEPDHIAVEDNPDSAHQGDVDQNPADHRADPSDIRWNSGHSRQSEPAPRTSSATARAGWSESVLLDENGKAMNKPPKPTPTGLTGDASIDGTIGGGAYDYKVE